MISILTLPDNRAEEAFHPERSPLFLLVVTGVMAGAITAYGGWIAAIVLIGLVLLFRWPVQISLGTLAFILPFDNVSALGAQVTGPAVTRYVAGVAALVLITLGLATDRLALPPKAALWWSMFVLWATFTVGWALTPQLVWVRIPTAFSLLFLYLVASSFRISWGEMSFVLLSTLLGGLTAAVIASSQFIEGTLFHNTVRGSLMLAGRETDPNYLAASLLLPLSLSLGILVDSRLKCVRIGSLFATVAIGLAVFFTMSRGALMAVSALAVLYMYRLKANKWIVIAVACLTSLLLLMPYSFFERLSLADRGAGRFDIWIAASGLLTRYGLLGAGVDNFVVAYNGVAGNAPMFRGFARGAHNIYLGMVVEAGIIGLAFLLLAFRSQLREVQQRCLLPYEAACWAMMTIGLTLDLVWRKSFWFCWIMLAMMTRLSRDSCYGAGADRTFLVGSRH